MFGFRSGRAGSPGSIDLGVSPEDAMRRMQAVELSNAACMALKSGDYKKSVDLYNECLRLRMKLNLSKVYVSIPLVNAADAYTMLKMFDEAEKVAQEGLKLRKECNDPDLPAAVECLRDLHKARAKAQLPAADWGSLQKTFCSNYGCVNKGKLLSCGKCHGTKYCSRDCQKIHWRYDHKHLCKA